MGRVPALPALSTLGTLWSSTAAALTGVAGTALPSSGATGLSASRSAARAPVGGDLLAGGCRDVVPFDGRHLGLTLGGEDFVGQLHDRLPLVLEGLSGDPGLDCWWKLLFPHAGYHLPHTALQGRVAVAKGFCEPFC